MSAVGTRSIVGVACAGLLALFAGVATGQSSSRPGSTRPDASREPARPSARPSASPAGAIGVYVKRESETLLKGDALDDKAAAQRVKDAEALLLRVAMISDPARETESWTLATKTLQLTRLVAAADAQSRADLAGALRACPLAAEETAFLLNSEDDLPGAGAVFLALHKKFGAAIDRTPALVAALCAVRDKPLVVQCNENKKQAAPVEDLYAFFTSSASRSLADMKAGPATMLVYIVDAAPDPAELAWALDKHAGTAQIGPLYSFIQYDDDHYRDRKPKKLTQAGFSLQNIARVGGVCIDQAYYAANVGKAVGVPAIIVRGAGKDGEGHAWLGYLKRQGRAFAWDMTEGRYPDSGYVSGVVHDPRSGRRCSEAEIGVQASLFATASKDVRLARSSSEAAALIATATSDPSPIRTDGAPASRPGATTPASETKPASEKSEAGPPFVRARGPASADQLLRAAHKSCPALPELWVGVVALAPSMDVQAMGWWIDAAAKLGGPAGRPGSWPEFTFDVTDRMLAALQDHDAAARAWDKVFGLYQSRPDLALRARVGLAQRAEMSGDPAMALRAYEDALKRYGASGPFALRAIAGAQKLLEPHGPEARQAFASLLADVWRRIERPSQSTLLYDQSMWVIVGMVYADALAKAGDATQAQAIRKQIEGGRPARR